MDTSSVTDSSDWLSTPLAGLAPLESSLRCQVCKDFFTTPMITSCSHTFCSLCIRRYLSQEGRCPACREQDQEMKLRRNWVVEELVAEFTASRKQILDFVKKTAERLQDDKAENRRPSKRRKLNSTREPDNGTTTERRSTRSQTKRHTSQQSASQQTPLSTQEEIADSDEGSVYDEPSTSHHFDGPSDSSLNDGLVGCPSCSRRMKESLVNGHLDKCLAGEADSPTSSQSPHPPHVKSGTIAYAQTKPSNTVSQRLPTLNYSLINDNALRRKLKDLGIPSTGSKELMKKRHTEWINLWNANCDSLQPVSKLQLLKDLAVWERTLGRQVEREKQANGVMIKEFDREGYVKRQKSEFDDLIAKARQNRAKKQDETAESEADVNPKSDPDLDKTDGRCNADGNNSDEAPDEVDVPSSNIPANTGDTDHTFPAILSSPPSPSRDEHWRRIEQMNPTVPPPSSQRSIHDITT